jgi:hypothetical protein
VFLHHARSYSIGLCDLFLLAFDLQLLCSDCTSAAASEALLFGL